MAASMRSHGRLDVGVIGAGPVGRAIAAALAGAGHQLVGVATTSLDRMEALDAMLPGCSILPIPELVEQSDLVVLAIPGTAIAGLVAGMRTARLWKPGQLVVHTNAAFGIEPLAPVAELGAIPLAIHPALTFNGTTVDLDRMRSAYFGVTASPAMLPVAEALVIEMGGEPFTVDEADRATYAEAVGVATEYSHAIIEQAAALLRSINVPSAGRVLRQISTSALGEALLHAEWEDKRSDDSC